MLIFKAKSRTLSVAARNFLVSALNEGQILVLPTDTLYGLSARADNQVAIRRIYRLKEKAVRKPLLILVSDFTMLKKYAAISPREEKKLRKIWGVGVRPTTVILNNKGVLPKELISPSGGLAIRLPKSLFLIKIIKKLGAPIVSTSFNLSGEKPISSAKEAINVFATRKNAPDIFVDKGLCRRQRGSKLIDLRARDQALVLRK